MRDPDKKQPREAQPPLRVGITGGIGSGKTTICRIFESLGIPVYYADDWAKWLTVNDPDVRVGILDRRRICPMARTTARMWRALFLKIRKNCRR
jgi:Dephospho-CoA kinase